MTIESFVQVLHNIAMADNMSYWLVGALTAIAFTVMRSMLPVKGLSLVLAPAIFWGGLSGIYALASAGIYFTTEKSANILISATVGMAVALVVMIALVKLVEQVLRIRNPLVRPTEPAIEPRRVRL